METVSVRDLPVVGRGKCGNVYALDRERIIKVYNSFIPLSAVEKERDNAKRVHDLGIPSPDVFDIVQTEEGAGLIYERVDAPSLTSLMKAEPSRMREYAGRLGALCRRVHKVRAEGFAGATQEFLDRLSLAKARISRLCGEDVSDMLERLIRLVPDRPGIVHGDFHPDNVLVRDGELILLDMADVMTGHPIFDLLSLYCLRVNKVKMWTAVEANLDRIRDADTVSRIRAVISKMQETTFPPEMAAAFWEGFLDGYADGRDQAYRERLTRLADGFSYLYMALSERSSSFLGEEITDFVTAEGVRVLLDRYGELTGEAAKQLMTEL